MEANTANHLLGDRAESAFMTEVMSRGYRAARPYSAHSPYDVIVDSGVGRLWRVQVKTVGPLYLANKRMHHYRVTLLQGNGKRTLSRKENDFLAVLVMHCAIWYLIPLNAIRARSAITLLPDIPGSKYDRFREAWHLLGRARLPALPKRAWQKTIITTHKIPQQAAVERSDRKRWLQRSGSPRK
jgi:hypothetical protein